MPPVKKTTGPKVVKKASAKKASDSLAGKEPTEEAFKEAGSIAKTECSPIEDMRGTADQRKHLVDVLTARTLGKALERIEG